MHPRLNLHVNVVMPVFTGITTDMCCLDFVTVNPKAILSGLKLVSVSPD